MTFTKNAQRLTAAGSGVAFLIALLALAIAVPDPTPFQYTVFRIVLALAAAAFAATIPGFLEVTISGIARATGAIAVFMIVYFFSPAGMVLSGPNSSIELGPQTPKPFEAVTEMPGVHAYFAGTVKGGASELIISVSLASLSYPQAAPDGGDRYIPYYRVVLAKHEENSWTASYQTEKQPVDQALRVGESLSLEPKTLILSVPGLTSLAGRWLVFEIGVSVSKTERVPGTTYAHMEPNFF